MLVGCCRLEAQKALDEIEGLRGSRVSTPLNKIYDSAQAEGRSDVCRRIDAYQSFGAETEGDVYRLFAYTMPSKEETRAIYDSLDPDAQAPLRNLIKAAYEELHRHSSRIPRWRRLGRSLGQLFR